MADQPCLLFNACACLGPAPGDSECPCAMRAKGLTPNVKPWSDEDRKRLTEALKELDKRKTARKESSHG